MRNLTIGRFLIAAFCLGLGCPAMGQQEVRAPEVDVQVSEVSSSSADVAEESAEEKSEEKFEPLSIEFWRISLADSSKVAGLLADGAGEGRLDLGSHADFAQRLAGLQQSGGVTKCSSMQCSAVLGHPVMLQVGFHEPRITGTARNDRTGQTRSIVYEPIGTLLQVESERVQAGIMLSVGYEHSELQETDLALTIPAEGERVNATKTTTDQFTTSLVARPDRPQVLVKRDNGKAGVEVFVICVHLEGP